MIQLLRVDDKLLHGQVAFSWVRNLKIQTVVIADDQIAYDEFMKMTLGLSKPNGVHLQILEVKDAVAYLQDQLRNDHHVMAIVNCIGNAYRIMEQIPSINSLNLGSLRERYDSKSMTEFISLNEEEIALCKELIASGKEIEMRMRYDDKKLDLAKFLR